MDIHPIIVHFPIALLTLYALGEIVLFFFPVHIRNKFKISQQVLLYVGTASIFAALASGEEASKNIPPAMRSILYRHEIFANITKGLFLTLVIINLLPYAQNLLDRKGYKLPNWIKRFHKNRIKCTLAIGGLGSITITGALGGAIVYGPSADPFIRIILILFGLTP